MSGAVGVQDPDARATRKGAGTAARAAVLAVAAALLLGSGACSEKITSVDPGFTTPEGEASSQTALVLWREIPNKLYIFTRGQTDEQCPAVNTHVLTDSVTLESTLPGQLHGAVLDSTPASAYQVYRREANGGYRELFDFTPVAARRWFDRGWETYHFTDPDTAMLSRTYRGRGVVGGSVTPASPLTNEASRNAAAVERITYTGPTGFDACGFPVAAGLDSLFPMEWKPVPGAAAYVIHVYQWSFSLTRLEDQIASAMPAPLYIGKSVDILVAYMPAPNPSPATITFRMPAPGARPPEARIMTCRQTRYGQEYIVRIAAVDALGQLIAYTYGTFSQELTGLIPGGIALPSSQFAVFRLGGVKVVPKRPTAPLLRARPGGTSAP